MYLNTVFKYNVFKYCPALPVGISYTSSLRFQIKYLVDIFYDKYFIKERNNIIKNDENYNFENSEVRFARAHRHT